MGNQMEYYIYIDVSVDIEAEFLEENDVRLMKMQYSLGEEQLVYEKRTTDDFMHTFYEKMRNGASSGTSQITPSAYEEVFRAHLQEGKGVLYLSLSSGLSNTYSSSLLAIENLKETYGEEVAAESVDTLAATGGMGLLLLDAVENRRKGMSLKENAEDLRQRAGKVCHWFMVDDLMFLKRGGRISAATAIVGSALNVKPVLKIDDNGKLVTISKQRGVAKTLKYMAGNFEQTRDPSMRNDVFVIHGDCPERAEELKALVLAADPQAKVHICMLGPVIGAHTGPGMAAVIHYGNRNGQGK